MLDYIIKNIYLLSAAAMLAIGHFYDDRLVVYNINVTLIISIFYENIDFIPDQKTLPTHAMTKLKKPASFKDWEEENKEIK